MGKLFALGLGVAFVATGCVDGFQGSNVQLDLAAGIPAAGSSGAPTRAGQLPPNTHYTLYGIEHLADSDALFPLQEFEVHQIVDPNSPCFIDVGDHVRFPGVHATQYAKKLGEVTGITDYKNPPAGATENDKIDAATAAQREMNIAALSGAMGLKAVTSATYAIYPPVAADCNGGDTAIPPPMCDDDASNARRLQLCQAAWKSDKNLWEGTDRVLTAPLAGTTYGLVDGTNPINMAPVGGASIYIDEAAYDMDAFAIYYVMDGAVGPGTQLLYGTPTHPTRGVAHVHMTSTTNPDLTAELAVFANLGEDDVHF